MSKNQELCQKALDELDQKNFTKALKYFDKISPDFEYYGDVVCEKFVCMIESGQSQMVLDRFHEMPKDSKSYINALINKIIALKNVGKYKEALEEYKNVKLDSDHDAFILLVWHAGEAAVKAKEYKSAEEILKQLLGIHDFIMNANSDADKVYDLLIECANELQNPALATYYETEKTGWINMMGGFKAMSEDDYDKALDFYNKVPEGSSLYQHSIVDKMKLFVDFGKSEEALTEFEKISKDSDVYYMALLNKQAALNELERYSESLAIFDEMLEKDICNSLALENSFDAARSNKDYNKLLFIANKMTELAEDEEEEEKAIYETALAHYYLNQYEEVIKLLEEVDEDDEDESYCPLCCDNQVKLDSTYLLGCTYRKLGDTEKAEKYFEEAEDMSDSGVSAVITDANGHKQTITEGYNQPFDPDDE